MQEPIPTLRGTPTHKMAVELYQRHNGDQLRVCVRCGEPGPCPVRAFAASVITAAGEDPRWYDGRLIPQPVIAPDFRDKYPDLAGYAIGGRTAQMSAEGFLYERDQ